METMEYAIMYPSDYTWDLIPELGEYFDIPIDIDVLDNALMSDGFSNEKNIVKFYDPKNKKNEDKRETKSSK